MPSVFQVSMISRPGVPFGMAKVPTSPGAPSLPGTEALTRKKFMAGAMLANIFRPLIL